MGAWQEAARRSCLGCPTLVTKSDILSLIEDISEDYFKFDEAVYYLKGWRAIKEQGHLDRLLSRARVTSGERNPNKTTYLFVWKDGYTHGVVITNSKHWKEKYTVASASGSRHEMLVLKSRIENKLKNELTNS